MEFTDAAGNKHTFTQMRFSTVEAMRDFLVSTINGLKRGDCFCEMAIGNPMISEHSQACKGCHDGDHLHAWILGG